MENITITKIQINDGPRDTYRVELVGTIGELRREYVVELHTYEDKPMAEMQARNFATMHGLASITDTTFNRRASNEWKDVFYGR